MTSTPSGTTILVSDFFAPDLIDRLSTSFPDVTFIPLAKDGTVPPEGWSATALLRAALSKEALARALAEAPQVRWIHTSTAGFDWLMIPEVVAGIERGVLEVTRSASSYSVAIGEFVIGAVFLLVKRFPAFMEAQKERRWASLEPLELASLTIGVVGAGAIGAEVARRAQALGMQVIGTRREPRPVEGFNDVLPPDQLLKLMATADVVVLAAPLTPETSHMIGESELRAMKPSAYLINVGRGALLVDAALERALREGWIAGALLDVFETEPLPSESPLWNLPNLIVTPHTSFRSPRNMERILDEFSANLRRFLDGKPLANALRDLTLGY